MKETIRNHLLAKEMTRKEFLQYGVGVVLAVLGFGNIISWLSKTSSNALLDKNGEGEGRRGFGSSKFGV